MGKTLQALEITEWAGPKSVFNLLTLSSSRNGHGGHFDHGLHQSRSGDDVDGGDACK